MAVALSNVTRVNDADALGSVWQDLAGTAAVSEVDFVYQGTNSVSEKVKTSEQGIKYYNSATSHALSTNDRTVIFKVQATNKDVLNARGATGGICEIGSGNRANYYRYYVLGNDNYPKVGGWVVVPINPNIVGPRSATVGTPNLAVVDNYNWACTFSATSKSENVVMDAIDFVDAGGGLIFTGTAGVFADFVTFDEGTIGNSYGLATSKEGVLFVYGTLTIGSATLTTFEDTGSVIIFPHGFFNTSFQGLAFGMANASNNIDLINETLQSNGVGRRARFNTETGIDGTNEIISGTLGSAANLRPVFPIGVAVIARSQGGTETPGLTNGTRYWVGHSTAGGGGIRLHTTQANAIAGTSPVNLTASTAGNGEIWRIDVDVDTRAVINVTGTSGALDFLGGSVSRFRSMVLTSVTTITNTILNNLQSVTQAGAVLNGVVVNLHTTLAAESFLVSDDLNDIIDCEFDNTAGRGHAVQSTVTGTVSRNSVGNKFTGYHSVADQTLHQFDNTTDVSSANDTITLPTGHGYVTGSPVVYSRVITANTAISGLTDQTLYYLSQFSGDAFTLHLNEGDALNGNAPINLTVGTGNETHALWPGNAAFFNNGATTTALTLNVSGGGDTPSVRNALNCTTTVVNAVTLVVQVDDADGNPVSGARVRIENASTGAEISQGSTNGSGTYTDATYNFAGDLAVLTKVRLKGFKPFRTGGTITVNGLTVGVTFQADNIVDLP